MLGILLLFHFMNKQLFGIGVFPVLASAMTLLFLPPDWPRRLFNWPRSAAGAPAGSHLKRTTVPLLAVYLAVQILVPLRHFFYPGNVSWTEEGHRFAWHMKLRDKDCSSAFELTDPSTGETWEEDAYDYLSSHQSRKMPSRPYLALQFARYLRQVAAQNGHGAVQVRARIECSLNGRYQYALIDPDVDLARQTYGLASAAWILPLPDSEPGEIFR
jgi:hypothetical protein